jgi:hypothetical protein
VEINPTKRFIVNFPINLPDTTGTKSANELLINKSQNQLENTQSIISLPEGGKVTVQIIGSDAAASSKIDLLLRQPEQQTLVEYANHEPGFSWTSPGYPTGSSVEFGIYWYWNNWGTIYQGNEAGALITQIDDDMYQIGFEAAGDDWDYNELVIDVKVETYLPLVLIDPPNISTGETAFVSVKKQYYDGRVEDFPTGQIFEFGMMEGCAAGGLVSGADTATYFNGVTQPMLFVAADSLENAEETVKIGVGLIEGTSGGEIINTKIAEADGDKQKAKNEGWGKNPQSINALFVGGNCFGGELQSAKIGFGDVVVENEPELIILEPNSVTVDKHISADPSMPTLTIKAQMKNYLKGEFNFEWKFILYWTNNRESPHRTIKKIYTGSEPGLSSEISTWNIDLGNEIRGGDIDTLYITVYDVPSSKIYKKAVINPYKIIGNNPTIEAVKDGLTLQEQVVAYLESRPKWHHFDNDGFPVFGPPHGYGLMQLDPPDNDNQIWNWRTNRTGGIQRLQNKRTIFADGLYYRVLKKYPMANYYNVKELMIQVWQLYNGGYYYEWIPENPKDRMHTKGKWIKSHPKVWPGHSKPYGEEAFDIYDAVLNGDTPSGWNN